MTAGEDSLRDRQRAQIRTDIRRAAFRLFLDRGYDTVTTEEIAAAAGVSPRTLFRHVPAKEDLLLAPVRHGGAAILSLLEHRPAGEPPDTALTNAIVARVRSFDQADCEEWRDALLAAPGLLARVSIHTPVDRDRATQLIAERMGVDADRDMRPGLLVQLAFAAADFAFQRWVRQPSDRRPLDVCVSEALEAIKGTHWRRRPQR